MATGNIDSPLTERNSNFPSAFSCWYANTSPVLDMEQDTPYMNLPSTAMAELYPVEETMQLNNRCTQPATAINNNDTSGDLSLTWSSHAHQELFKSLGINDNDILQWGNRNLSGQQLMRSVIPEEQLSITVEEEEDDSVHSWRPRSANSLSSDFFLPPIELSIPLESDKECNETSPPVIENVSSGETGEYSGRQVESAVPRPHPNNSRIFDPRHDVQSYLQSQKSELNILKYEVMNAKRRIIEGREIVANLDSELKEQELFQNSQEIEKLKEENAQLRLECQCLCMEVDFYVKGQAPLGEIDENFYKKSTTQNVQTVNPTPSTAQSDPRNTTETGGPDSLEEGNKWECHKCTFANHPAINCCEMCQVPRIRRSFPSLSSSDTCFCHPKEKTPSS